MTRALALGLLVTSLVGSAAAETVTWQAAVIAGGGERRVVGNGVKTYAPERDVVVQKHLRRRDGVMSFSKSLMLSPTFAVSVNVRRDPSLDGFGLAIRRRGDQNGYSWNWFLRVGEREFEGPRGLGMVSVTTRKGAGYEELDSVEFLDDVALLYLDDVRRVPGAYSHEVVIRKGSVLRFAAAGSAAQATAKSSAR